MYLEERAAEVAPAAAYSWNNVTPRASEKTHIPVCKPLGYHGIVIRDAFFAPLTPWHLTSYGRQTCEGGSNGRRRRRYGSDHYERTREHAFRNSKTFSSWGPRSFNHPRWQRRNLWPHDIPGARSLALNIPRIVGTLATATDSGIYPAVASIPRKYFISGLMDRKKKATKQHAALRRTDRNARRERGTFSARVIIDLHNYVCA